MIAGEERPSQLMQGECKSTHILVSRCLAKLAILYMSAMRRRSSSAVWLSSFVWLSLRSTGLSSPNGEGNCFFQCRAFAALTFFFYICVCTWVTHPAGHASSFGLHIYRYIYLYIDILHIITLDSTSVARLARGATSLRTTRR